jgi:hypothetical protein
VIAKGLLTTILIYGLSSWRPAPDVRDGRFCGR